MGLGFVVFSFSKELALKVRVPICNAEESAEFSWQACEWRVVKLMKMSF